MLVSDNTIQNRNACACLVTLVISDSVTLWTIACQASLSMGFSMQEYWNELSCPSPWILPDRGFKPTSLMSPALAGGFHSHHLGNPYTICMYRYYIYVNYKLTLATGTGHLLLQGLN